MNHESNIDRILKVKYFEYIFKSSRLFHGHNKAVMHIIWGFECIGYEKSPLNIIQVKYRKGHVVLFHRLNKYLE